MIFPVGHRNAPPPPFDTTPIAWFLADLNYILCLPFIDRDTQVAIVPAIVITMIFVIGLVFGVALMYKFGIFAWSTFCDAISSLKKGVEKCVD
jgi:hypothetical protein